MPFPLSVHFLHLDFSPQFPSSLKFCQMQYKHPVLIIEPGRCLTSSDYSSTACFMNPIIYHIQLLCLNYTYLPIVKPIQGRDHVLVIFVSQRLPPSKIHQMQKECLRKT